MENSNRYSRQIVLPEIGTIGQQKLLNAKVLVIGAGGLGCPVLQMLVAAGVGTLGIVDGDVVEETNLHRQLLYTKADCEKNKVDVAQKVIGKVNADVRVNSYVEFLNQSNIAFITNNYDILVDCTDDIATRYLINDIAVFTQKPMVYASVHKFEGQVSVFNYQNGPTYRCLFPEKETGSIPNCNTTGVLGVLPNTLGMLQATEVLKMILGIGAVLSGRVLVYNALELSFNEIEFKKSLLQTQIGFENGERLSLKKNQNHDLDKTAFLEKCTNPNYTIIDLREAHEQPKLPYSSIVEIPFSEIETYQSNLKKNQPIVLFCQSGMRSNKALKLFASNGFTNVYHLHKGIKSLQLSITI